MKSKGPLKGFRCGWSRGGLEPLQSVESIPEKRQGAGSSSALQYGLQCKPELDGYTGGR